MFDFWDALIRRLFWQFWLFIAACAGLALAVWWLVK